jgi:hypothetical protein
MARAGKIEQHNLGQLVVDSLAEGLNSYDIAAKISAMGVPVSQATVARWIKDNREKNQSKASALFSEHVERELPKDLDALESMEALCLAWAKEDQADKVERIVAWRRVDEALDELLRMIREAESANDDKQRRAALKRVVARVLGWVLDDVKDQSQRLASMKMATGIIETKLRNTGLLGDNDKGRIIIKPYDESRPLGEGGGPGETKRHLFTVKTAKE